jgi:UDP-N-acetylmuramoylalanine--D-glutamate ligase
VRVGGNLGTPALDLLGRGPTDLYVLEMSSFQLEATASLRLKVGTVLNLSADHMDRYGSMAEYAAAKARIFAHCETAVVNADDDEVIKMPRSGQRTFRFSLRADSGAEYVLAHESSQWWLAARGELLMPQNALKIAGRHNAANALAALAVGDALRLPRNAMIDELEEFPGLAHRTQWVADVRGVTYVNDSKGTNVGATVAAVAGMPGPLVVIVGGDGKNQDFTPLAASFRGKVRRAVLIGRDARTIATVVADVCDIEFCKTLDDAVRAAARAAQAGDTVLLSPACASLDMFRDYTHRGSVFTAAVRELAP